MENAQDVLARWKKAMTQSTGKMKEKIMGLQSNPMLKAAEKKDAYVAGIMDAAESGRWEDGLRSVDFAEWKRKTAEVGTARIAAGVEAASSKMLNFLQQSLPYTEAVSKMVQQMPDATLEDRIQRATTAMRKMAEFKYRKQK